MRTLRDALSFGSSRQLAQPTTRANTYLRRASVPGLAVRQLPIGIADIGRQVGTVEIDLERFRELSEDLRLASSDCGMRRHIPSMVDSHEWSIPKALCFNQDSKCHLSELADRALYPSCKRHNNLPAWVEVFPRKLCTDRIRRRHLAAWSPFQRARNGDTLNQI